MGSTTNMVKDRKNQSNSAPTKKSKIVPTYQ